MILITKQGGGGDIIQLKKILQNAKLSKMYSVTVMEVTKIPVVLILKEF